MEEKDIIKEIPDLYEDNGLWRGTQYSFFSHKNCEFFPCHKTDDPDNFNCLFCYCPLYMLGRDCGGNFTYLENGVKDCSKCLVPHRRNNYGYIASRFQSIVEEMSRREGKGD